MFAQVKQLADKIGQDAVTAYDLWRQNDVDGQAEVLERMEADALTLVEQITTMRRADWLAKR